MICQLTFLFPFIAHSLFSVPQTRARFFFCLFYTLSVSSLSDILRNYPLQWCEWNATLAWKTKPVCVKEKKRERQKDSATCPALVLVARCTWGLAQSPQLCCHTRHMLYEPQFRDPHHNPAVSQSMCFHGQHTGLVRSSRPWVIARCCWQERRSLLSYL